MLQTIEAFKRKNKYYKAVGDSVQWSGIMWDESGTAIKRKRNHVPYNKQPKSTCAISAEKCKSAQKYS